MKLVVCLLVALTSTVWAWDFRGHRVVVAIACDYLAPATREWVENCLSLHPDPRVRTLDGAAVWPDLVRKEQPETGPWHVINYPVGPLPGPQLGDEDHLVWAVEHFREAVAISGQGEKRAEALAFLLHLVGDAHQPLHACSYYGPEFPSGDKGGGKVLLDHPWAKNLHKFWDSAGEPPERTVEELKARALSTSGGPRASSVDPKVWVEEGYALAREAVYPSQRLPGPQLSPEYQLRARQLCAQRLFLAGLRLAYVLEKLGPGANYQP